jgi:hypothetical protein
MDTTSRIILDITDMGYRVEIGTTNEGDYEVVCSPQWVWAHAPVFSFHGKAGTIVDALEAALSFRRTRLTAIVAMRKNASQPARRDESEDAE